MRSSESNLLVEIQRNAHLEEPIAPTTEETQAAVSALMILKIGSDHPCGSAGVESSSEYEDQD
jgi:hypothetical protein